MKKGGDTIQDWQDCLFVALLWSSISYFLDALAIATSTSDCLQAVYTIAPS